MNIKRNMMAMIIAGNLLNCTNGSDSMPTSALSEEELQLAICLLGKIQGAKDTGNQLVKKSRKMSIYLWNKVRDLGCDMNSARRKWQRILAYVWNQLPGEKFPNEENIGLIP
ncbi:MAG: hypothetical protein LBD60_00445 [Puniceicoccales bacterium]|jgi:hypothetical protein|nr:hypothetical protein [Puniceicoccales bacterium]